MNGLATIIAHNALAALVLAITVWIVTRFVRRPAIAHVLWLLVLLRLIAPPVVGFEYAAWPADTVDSASPAIESRPPIAFAETTARSLGNWINLHSKATRADANPVIANQPAFDAGTFTASYVIDRLPFVLLGVTILLAFIAAARIVRFRRRIAKLDPGSADLQAIVVDLSHRLALARVPQVRVGTLAGAPFVWNLGPQPTIVLPASFIAAFSSRQLAMILTHELAHLRRRDHWVRLIELVVAITHWWNPLAHWVRRRLHDAEEQCCDAWVAWTFPGETQQYAETLLQASELASPRHARAPWLISPLFRTHPLKARIAMIVQGRTPHRNSRLAILLLAAAALIALPSYVTLTAADENESGSPDTSASQPTAEPQATSSAAAQSEPNPDDPARLNVTVLVSGTNEPVEGAAAIALLGYFEAEGNIASRTSKTDAEGKCSLPVPYGHLRSWWPFLPAGYWLEEPENPEQNEAFVTSPSNPTCAVKFLVQRGTVWNLRAHDADTSERVGQLQCNVYPQDPRGFKRAGPTILDANGLGQFTPPGSGGNYRLNLFGPFNLEKSIRSWMQFRHVSEPGLTIDDGFDPNLIAEIQPGMSAGESVLVDRNGRRTQLRGATAVIENGVLFVDVAVRRVSPTAETGRGIGTVVDSHGKPVANARVVLQIQMEDSQLSWTSWQARTDAAGRFEIEQITIASAPGTETESARLVATAAADGFAPQNSAPTAYPAAPDQAADFGRITLAPGHSARVRVVDVLGGPAAGAVVTPTFDLQPTRRNITDERGEVLLRDLPAGKVTLAAAYGTEAGMLEISTPVSDDNRICVLRLQLDSEIDAPADGPASVAQPAPPLQIAAWTDGNNRTLEEFKGRVVALYFWDSAQEGCDQELAIIDSLRQRFAEDGVVFLGIHAARTSLDEVAAWMKEKDWRLPTGLDKSDDSKASLTTTAYGVSSPSFVVIGKDGNIAFNRDAVLDDDNGERLYKQAAQALNIDLEAEEQKPDQEGCDACAQIMEYIQSRAIQNALGPPSE